MKLMQKCKASWEDKIFLFISQLTEEKNQRKAVAQRKHKDSKSYQRTWRKGANFLDGIFKAFFY